MTSSFHSIRSFLLHNRKRWLCLLVCAPFFCSIDRCPTAAGAADLPLPQKVGESFLLDDFDSKVTSSDLGCNYFGGNTGTLSNPEPKPGTAAITSLSYSPESSGSAGGSLRLGVNFTGLPREGTFGGWFSHLFGLSDTKVRLDAQTQEPPKATPFPGYRLNFNNFFGAMGTMQNRSIERLLMDVRLDKSSPSVLVKLELSDSAGRTIYTRRNLTGKTWSTLNLKRSDFSLGNPGSFDWTQVEVFSVIVERYHGAEGVDNPLSAAFFLDNLRLVDDDGPYPDLSAIANPVDKSLRPEYARAFLDLVRARSFQYFLDFASTDERTGGAIQDRGPFADLMSVGGVGFQLSAYVMGAERGYVSRTDAADRVLKLLRVLHDAPQGPEYIGNIGYRGFFYHFLGTDGRRKLNFDWQATTSLNEALNTVELSTIDTALALAGVIASSRYFTASNASETEIRTRAQSLVARVDWPFMLRTVADGKKQFALGWKPNEVRDDTSGRWGRFLLGDGQGTGQFSSKSVRMNGVPTEVDATLDYYTDEALLVILLAMSAQDPAHRVPRAAWDDLIRQGEPFVTTYPGSLFTYQFGSVWLDTLRLGRDNHALRPVNWFDNTRAALRTARLYAIDHPANLPSPAADFWGWSACEGPFDSYAAEAAPPLALASDAGVIAGANLLRLEAENFQGNGIVKQRGSASKAKTRYFLNGQQASFRFSLPTASLCVFQARYSNDGPTDTVIVKIDGRTVGMFVTADTRPADGRPGEGWDNFFTVTVGAGTTLSAGNHEIAIAANTDSYGVEIDWIGLNQPDIIRPLNTGVLTVYGVGSSMVHVPAEALSALWSAARLDLNQDGRPDLFHPRFGFADAFCLDISEAALGVSSDDTSVLRRSGAWLNPAGFAIDHGPMLLLIDNYLSGNFLPKLFMSDPRIRDTLAVLFPNQQKN